MTATPRERGAADGEADARQAWTGVTWKRSDRYPPVNQFDRQEYLEGYAYGFAAYNRTIEPIGR